MRKSLSSALLVSLVLLSSELSFAHAYSFETDPHTGSLCKERDPMNITYYNQDLYYPPSSGAISYWVPLAAEVWNDVPAKLFFVATSDPSAATVRIASINSQVFTDHGIAGITYTLGNQDSELTCHNGYVDTPIEIAINRGTLSRFIQLWPQIDREDLTINAAAHEMGHALGLDHPTFQNSLMWTKAVDPDPNRNPDNILAGIFFPTVDDIKGAAALYGWAADTPFFDFNEVGGGITYTYPQYNVPIELSVSSPNSGSYSKVYKSTSLPSLNIAMMMGYVTPKTLYRFHMGWQAASGDFSDIELDNDGIKMRYSEGNPYRAISAFSPPPTSGTSYFLEAVVYRRSTGILRTHAYAYQGSIQTGNGGEIFLGHVGANMDFQPCPWCPHYQASWSDATSFEAKVWTDSSSNPASKYDVNHFWNIQGSVLMKLGYHHAFMLDWADSNNNRIVDTEDAAYLSDVYMTPCSSLSGNRRTWCDYYDFNRDGWVSLVDAATFSSYFDVAWPASDSWFPGKGRPQFKMDSMWTGLCFRLPATDQPFCNFITTSP